MNCETMLSEIREHFHANEGQYTAFEKGGIDPKTGKDHGVGFLRSVAGQVQNPKTDPQTGKPYDPPLTQKQIHRLTEIYFCRVKGMSRKEAEAAIMAQDAPF